MATAPIVRVAAQGGSANSDRPNIILIVSDEHQANTCGCYGSTVRRVDGLSPTPHIDALAAEGVRFDAMYCASPLCAPSRAAYMTGAYPHTTTALYHKMQNREAGLSRFPGVRAGIPAMGDIFKKVGYKTAAYGKTHVHGEEARGWDLGFDERGLRFYTHAPGMHYGDLKDGDVNRRYREREPYSNRTYRDIDPVRFANAPEGLTVRQNGVNAHFLETLVEHEEEMIDHLVTDRSIDFIRRQAAAGKPFLMHVGLEKPHRPWTIHRRFMERFDPEEMPLPDSIAEWETKGMNPFVQQWCHSALKGEGAQNSIAAYYACASQVDDCVGRIMQACRDLGVLENTIIIYTSDHGESLYEHGLIEKHNMLDPAARVPFVIRAPWALPMGSACDSPTSLIDMIPTLCEMSGTPGSIAQEGVSILPAIMGRADPNRLVFSEFYQSGSVTRKDEFLPVRMGLNREFKYIYTHGAADQLFDRRAKDEALGVNRAFDSAHEATVSHLKLRTLDGWELDEYPMLEARVQVTSVGVSLTWESVAPKAQYDVYRSRAADPRLAERLAKGLNHCGWVDKDATVGRTYHYWVLGHIALDRPFVDPNGKSRHGSRLIVSNYYPRQLPVSRRLEVSVQDAFEQSYPYQPLLGSALCGLRWIHLGMPPAAEGAGARLLGPVTLLSPKPVDRALSLSAVLRTPRPGPGPRDTLHLVFGYLNMRQYYFVCLLRDGRLALFKREGEFAARLLASSEPTLSQADRWNQIEVDYKEGTIAVIFNGQTAFSASDPQPYLNGRFGFDVPLKVPQAQLRSVQTKFG